LGIEGVPKIEKKGSAATGLKGVGRQKEKKVGGALGKGPGKRPELKNAILTKTKAEQKRVSRASQVGEVEACGV